jgi:predicted PolB exonuclease-like 3'-5' exonuclease
MDHSTQIANDIKKEVTQQAASPKDAVAYIVFDTESIPDGELVATVKYPSENLSPDAAIERAQAEAKAKSFSGSDFLPFTFQKPVAICTLTVDKNFMPIGLNCLDTPQYRTSEMVKLFWLGIETYKRANLVSFNGRGFDLPLLELAAYDQGISATSYFASDKRSRYRSPYIDLQDVLSNQGSCKLEGGLNLLARRLGLPGKMGITGHDVYPMHKAGKLQEINDYCACDTIDTYFVFLRTKVLMGHVTIE